MSLRGACLFELRGQCSCLLQQGFHLHYIQLRNRADFKAPRKDTQRFLTAGNGLLSQRDALIEFAQRQITVRHLSDQAHRDRAACCIGGKVAFQRRLLEVAHPAPEIEFPGRDPHPNLILASGQRSSCRAQVGRRACPAAIDAGRNGRKLVGTLDTVSRPRFLNPQHGCLQIAVVLQRLRDQRLELRIGKIVAPGDFRGDRTTGWRVRLTRRIGGIH